MSRRWRATVIYRSGLRRVYTVRALMGVDVPATVRPLALKQDDAIRDITFEEIRPERTREHQEAVERFQNRR